MKLQGPDNNSGFFHDGVAYEPDANGCIDVPPEITGFAASHGFSPIQETPSDQESGDMVNFAKLNKKQLLAFAKDTLELDLDETKTNKELIAEIEAAMA